MRPVGTTIVTVGLLAGAACSDGTDDAAPTASSPTIVDTTIVDTSVIDDDAGDTTAATIPTTSRATTTTTTIPTTSTSAPTTTTTLGEGDDPGPDGFPPQPDGVPWPTAEWPVGEPPAGFDAATVDAAVEASFGAADATARMRSILAVHGGRIVYERYHPLDGPDVVLSSFSVAKSVTSTLVGMLVDDGVLDVRAPAPVPEWADDERSSITLEHLLHMASGLSWEEVFGDGGTVGPMLASDDWAAYAIDQPLEADPGERFEYSTGTTAILAEILADSLGGPDALEAFIRRELLEPLGITSTNLVEDSTGQFVGGLGFDSTTRDFARFGYLHLRGGRWDDDQILSPDWVRYGAEPSPAAPDYGAQWWLTGPHGGQIALGLFGQHVLVDHEHDLVIVSTSTAGGDARSPLWVLHDELARSIGEP